MKRLRLFFCAAAALATGPGCPAAPLPPASKADSLGPGRISFQADNCTITKVDSDDESLSVQFTGRWLSNASGKWANTDKNGFSVTREKSLSSASWRQFVQHFLEVRDKKVTLLVFSGRGYTIRGGIPLFQYPSERFQIVPDGTPFNFPVGYQF